MGGSISGKFFPIGSALLGAAGSILSGAAGALTGPPPENFGSTGSDTGWRPPGAKKSLGQAFQEAWDQTRASMAQAAQHKEDLEDKSPILKGINEHQRKMLGLVSGDMEKANQNNNGNAAGAASDLARAGAEGFVRHFTDSFGGLITLPADIGEDLHELVETGAFPEKTQGDKIRDGINEAIFPKAEEYPVIAKAGGDVGAVVEAVGAAAVGISVEEGENYISKARKLKPDAAKTEEAIKKFKQLQEEEKRLKGLKAELDALKAEQRRTIDSLEGGNGRLQQKGIPPELQTPEGKARDKRILEINQEIQKIKEAEAARNATQAAAGRAQAREARTAERAQAREAEATSKRAKKRALEGGTPLTEEEKARKAKAAAEALAKDRELADQLKPRLDEFNRLVREGTPEELQRFDKYGRHNIEEYRKALANGDAKEIAYADEGLEAIRKDFVWSKKDRMQFNPEAGVGSSP